MYQHVRVLFDKILAFNSDDFTVVLQPIICISIYGKKTSKCGYVIIRNIAVNANRLLKAIVKFCDINMNKNE